MPQLTLQPNEVPLAPGLRTRNARYKELGESGQRSADYLLVKTILFTAKSVGITSHELAQRFGVHRQKFAPRLSELYRDGEAVQKVRACFCSDCFGTGNMTAYVYKDWGEE